MGRTSPAFADMQATHCFLITPRPTLRLLSAALEYRHNVLSRTLLRRCKSYFLSDASRDVARPISFLLVHDLYSASLEMRIRREPHSLFQRHGFNKEAV